MKLRINWDALGVGASVACAIHCAFLPLFLSSLSLFGVNIIDNTGFEICMILIALFIGTYALSHGFRKHHHSWLPLLLFFSGFAFLILKQFFVRYETWLLIPAVILIVVAHIINYRYCRVQRVSASESCDH